MGEGLLQPMHLLLIFDPLVDGRGLALRRRGGLLRRRRDCKQTGTGKDDNDGAREHPIFAFGPQGSARPLLKD